MPTLALWLWLLFGALALGLRVAVHLRLTGETGLRWPTGQFGTTEWLAGVAFGAAVVLGVAAPILALVDAVEPIDALDTTLVHVLGLVVYGVGLAVVLAAQRTMGRSWRVGVDPSERTTLVTAGPFARVRNPIFTGMMLCTLGLALLVPSVVALASVALLLAALELQTRVVEEPYLLGSHGDAYADYSARVGRFLPGIGRLARR